MTDSEKTNKKLFFIAGEDSGDLHTSHLIRSLLSKKPDWKCVGFGGDKMKDAGAEIFFDLTKISALGLIEVLKKYPLFKKAFNLALKKVEETKPDAVVLTDFPGFNLRFAKEMKKRGIPVIFYVSPQVWAWKKKRIYSIPKIVDKMLVILPFEKDIYPKSSMEIDFVGHPLISHVKPTLSQEAFLKKHQLDPNDTLITLAPGSRKQEVTKIFPIMLQTAVLLSQKLEDVTFLITKTPNLRIEDYRYFMDGFELKHLFIEEETYNCFQYADFSLIKSGTSTLEATILGAPHVLIYKVNWLTYWAARLLVKIPYLGMANIIADKSIVPEYIQQDAKPAVISDYVIKLLKNKDLKEEMIANLKEVRRKLETPDPSEKAANSVVQFFDQNDVE